MKIKNRLQRTFFTVPTVHLAKNLLGCVLVRETEPKQMKGMITETEAYTEDDPASHSFKGRRTKRNEVMFASGGYVYVYISYGIHHCLNIVSEDAGRGCAVLIRAVKPIAGIATMQKNRGDRENKVLTDGPGKLCQAFGISLEHNSTDLTDLQSSIYIVGRESEPNIVASERIGISKGQNKKWRFTLAHPSQR